MILITRSITYLISQARNHPKHPSYSSCLLCPMVNHQILTNLPLKYFSGYSPLNLSSAFFSLTPFKIKTKLWQYIYDLLLKVFFFYCYLLPHSLYSSNNTFLPTLCYTMLLLFSLPHSSTNSYPHHLKFSQSIMYPNK